MNNLKEALGPDCCPFCGGKAIIHRGPFLGHTQGHWVSCVGLNCRVVPRAKARTETEAIALWNRRATFHQTPSTSNPAPELSSSVQSPGDRTARELLERFDAGWNIPTLDAIVALRGIVAALGQSTPGDAAVSGVGEAFVKAIAEERKRFNEGSPTWNAYGHCIAICEHVAVLRPDDNSAGEWRKTDTAPRDGTRFLAALQVRTNGLPPEWEQSVVWCDDETGEIASGCEFGWDFADIEMWQPLPPSPRDGSNG